MKQHMTTKREEDAIAAIKRYVCKANGLSENEVEVFIDPTDTVRINVRPKKPMEDVYIEMVKKLKCTKKPPRCPAFKNGVCIAYKKCEHQVGFSNGDRIRAMRDEELARITVKYCGGGTFICSDGAVTDNYEIAVTHETQWLKEEADNG